MTTAHQAKSLLTGGESNLLFNSIVLGKYEISYFQCQQTGFIQTEHPYWLHEAYAEPIANLDVGYLSRNIHSADFVQQILLRHFPDCHSFIDYGGGYGMFVRLMRDRGFDFVGYDPYCKNLFSPQFEHQQLSTRKYDFLTAFEVFEHLPDPINEIEKMFKLSDIILFSTELVPSTPLISVDDWWYFVPETGQHIALYTPAALSHIANLFQAEFYSDGKRLHIFSRKKIGRNPLQQISPRILELFFQKFIILTKRRDSLLDRDFLSTKNNLMKNIRNRSITECE